MKSTILEVALGKKATIHQVTTMLATSKNVLFPGHNHLLTASGNDPSLQLSPSQVLEQESKCQAISTGG